MDMQLEEKLVWIEECRSHAESFTKAYYLQSKINVRQKSW